jgi:hypothetical protein
MRFGTFLLRWAPQYLPAIRKMGVGWFTTISALFVVLGALGTYAATLWGKDWREKMDGRNTVNSIV